MSSDCIQLLVYIGLYSANWFSLNIISDGDLYDYMCACVILKLTAYFTVSVLLCDKVDVIITKAMETAMTLLKGFITIIITVLAHWDIGCFGNWLNLMLKSHCFGIDQSPIPVSSPNSSQGSATGLLKG